jgi:hypothetical protein
MKLIITIMKKSLVVFLAVGLTAGSLLADPAMLTKPHEFDFGWVPRQSTVMAPFWIRSTGTDTLKIVDILPSCECAHVTLDEMSIPPGDSALAYYYWETDLRQGFKDQFATFYTNTMAERPERIFLKGINVRVPDSLRPLSISPFRLELSKLGKVTVDSIQLKFTNLGDQDLVLTQVSAPVAECEVVIPDSVKSNSSAYGYVKLRPEYADQEFIRSVTLEITGPPNYERRITIPIRRKILAP